MFCVLGWTDFYTTGLLNLLSFDGDNGGGHSPILSCVLFPSKWNPKRGSNVSRTLVALGEATLSFCFVSHFESYIFFDPRRRFGFANPEALANGETGTACRGEEHDVTIVWSITSGKRLVLADGQEVHYSNSRNNVFDFSWTMRGNHVLKITAHASPPMSAEPGFRQYDFYVDGQSFFTFPKVYRLGLSANDPRAVASPHSPPSLADRGRNHNNSGPGSVRSNGQANIAVIEAPHNPDEEEAYLREAIKNSLVEQATPKDAASVKSAPAAPAGGGDNLLLDFFDGPAAAPAPGGVPALP